MCECKQISKTPSDIRGNSNYIFQCTNSSSTKEIKVTSENDNSAKMLAELECREAEKKLTEPTIEPYIDSTTIRTGNSIATIQVRHFLYTGAAAGTVYTEVTNLTGGECSTGVVMGVWSPWIDLISHIGVVNVSIQNSYPNDIGVKSEVKYYK